jgi:hypothetical protein
MYGYNAATLPRYRGQGLHALSINYTGRFLAAPQGKDMVAVLRAHNAKALISEARVSPLRMDVAILWVGRRRIHEWMTPSCRAIGLDFSKGPPPAAS